MTDPFRRLFLDQVDAILKKEPSQDSLLTLLQLATPGLVSLQGNSSDDMPRAFKTLLERLNPVHYPYDAYRSTSLTQSAHTFYQACLDSRPTKRQRRANSSQKNTTFPSEFSAIKKWPQFEIKHRPWSIEDGNHMSRGVAY